MTTIKKLVVLRFQFLVRIDCRDALLLTPKVKKFQNAKPKKTEK